MKRPIVVLVGALLGVGALALAVWWVLLRQEVPPEPEASGDPSASPSITISTSPTMSVTPSPVVSETAAEPSTGPTNQTPDLSARSSIPGATAVLTLATWDVGNRTVLVGGFVSGVFEDGGLCRFTVTAVDTGAERSVETQGAFNVESTTCGSHDVEVPDSQNGQFRVRLVYSNDSGTAMSEVITVETK